MAATTSDSSSSHKVLLVEVHIFFFFCVALGAREAFESTEIAGALVVEAAPAINTQH